MAEDRMSSTWGQALQTAQSRLRNAGIADAWLDAELLLSHVLKISRTVLSAYPDTLLIDREVRNVETLVDRRAKREPLPYIIGTREFFGHSFLVNLSVLIPRPETETLLEYALAWAHRRSILVGSPERVADVGTGSGCLAISLALALRSAMVYAIDQSEAALGVAKENARRLNVISSVKMLHGNLLEPLLEPVDLIIANLPYVPEAELPHLQPEVRDHEPHSALTPGGDGTSLNRKLLQQAPKKLRSGGAMFLEFDPPQRRTLAEEAGRAFPTAAVQILQDLAGRDRILAVSLPVGPNTP
ncbi:MAG: peptide chain release factor N(5)-glutamine methyltransferase [Dehalococcoidia bacterium]|nr:peptide chain release factor N(5)-glutamine methyltransferase [Dehalococcoidia bacterium]